MSFNLTSLKTPERRNVRDKKTSRYISMGKSLKEKKYSEHICLSVYLSLFFFSQLRSIFLVSNYMEAF